MKTLYAACLSRLGLSLTGAARLHNVRLDTVKSWSSGRNPVPQGAWDELRAYEAQIVDRSESMREAWDDHQVPIEIDHSEADDMMLMAAVDFVLGLPEQIPVHEGSSRATGLARQARRPN